MPWTDHKGKGGEYSGEMNRLMQPHGRGVLKYKDGTKLEVEEVTWVNGTPLEVEDRPCASEAKPTIEGLSSKHLRQSRRRRRSSTTQSHQPPMNLPGFHLGDVANPSDMMVIEDKETALIVTSLERDRATLELQHNRYRCL